MSADQKQPKQLTIQQVRQAFESSGSGDDFDAWLTKLRHDAWAAGCKVGLATNEGWEDTALARNPYKGGKP